MFEGVPLCRMSWRHLILKIPDGVREFFYRFHFKTFLTNSHQIKKSNQPSIPPPPTPIPPKPTPTKKKNDLKEHFLFPPNSSTKFYWKLLVKYSKNFNSWSNAYFFLLLSNRLECLSLKKLSYLIFSFFNDKRLLAPKYSETLHLKCSAPFIFLIWFSNRILRPFIFSIRFSDRISLLFPVYKLLL